MRATVDHIRQRLLDATLPTTINTIIAGEQSKLERWEKSGPEGVAAAKEVRAFAEGRKQEMMVSA